MLYLVQEIDECQYFSDGDVEFAGNFFTDGDTRQSRGKACIFVQGNIKVDGELDDLLAGQALATGGYTWCRQAIIMECNCGLWAIGGFVPVHRGRLYLVVD
jgi:hypothetical protein